MNRRELISLSVMLITPSLLLVATMRVQSRHRIHLRTNSVLFNGEVSRRITVGSTINEAKSFLEQNGFQCSIARSSNDWLQQIALGTPILIPPAALKLFAVKTTSAFPRFLDKQKWRIKVSFSGDRVTKTEAGYSYSKWD